MNIYQTLNQITEYIEEHLEEKILYNDLAKIMGVNASTMKKVFVLLTNLSVSEYIRKRRLSQAGFDFYSKKTKVIDVAIKYQYESATSFSRAFTSFHGIKPSKVDKNSQLKHFPRISFNEEILMFKDIEYSIVTLDELVLYGKGISVNNDNIGMIAPKFFNDMENKYLDLYGNIDYGMVTYSDSNRLKCDGYYILYTKLIDCFSKFVIPASQWLVFHVDSKKACDIQRVSKQFYYEFLPSCKYKLRHIPELEYYHDGITDFLVPIC